MVAAQFASKESDFGIRASSGQAGSSWLSLTCAQVCSNQSMVLTERIEPSGNMPIHLFLLSSTVHGHSSRCFVNRERLFTMCGEDTRLPCKCPGTVMIFAGPRHKPDTPDSSAQLLLHTSTPLVASISSGVVLCLPCPLADGHSVGMIRVRGTY